MRKRVPDEAIRGVLRRKRQQESPAEAPAPAEPGDEAKWHVLAHFDVDRTLVAEVQAPNKLDLTSGDELEFRVTYDMHDSYKGQETLHTTLHLETDNEKFDPVIGGLEEKAIGRKRRAGYIEQKIQLVRPGDRRISWRIECEFEVRMWGSGQVMHRESKDLEGVIRVQVSP